MPFIATIGDKQLSADDLPMDVWAEVAKAAGTDWAEIYWAPAKDAVGAPLLLRKIAAHLGVDPPDPITPKVLFSAWRFEKDDDLPTSFRDGLPSPEAAPTTD